MAKTGQPTIDAPAEAAATLSPLVWGEGLARALVAQSADVILVLSADHHCLFASPAIYNCLGYHPDQVLGQDVIPLHHPDDLPRAAAMLADAAAHPGKPARCDVRVLHRDGSWRWMSVSATNCLNDPAVCGIVCNLHDVTERVEAALATEAALRAQEVAQHDLQRVTAAKSDFLRLLGHEFKTPLTVIAGNAELLEMALADRAELLESTTAIRGEAARLSRLIDDLLLLDRMEATNLVLRREALDLNALLAETVSRMHGLAPEREFRLCLAEDLPRIQADPERISQVIVNLLGNAVKYSPRGGPVTAATSRDGDFVRLSITDNGVGIPASALPTLFERYQRVRSGETRQIAGTGLGLAIVQQIARLHGGETWAESVEGRGSTFHARLPIKAASPGT